MRNDFKHAEYRIKIEHIPLIPPFFPRDNNCEEFSVYF